MVIHVAPNKNNQKVLDRTVGHGHKLV